MVKRFLGAQVQGLGLIKHGFSTRKPMSPNTRKILVPLVAIALVGIGFLLRTHFREGHAEGHSHGTPDVAALSLDNGKRWATDVHLRAGMQRIQDAARPVLAAHATRKVSPSDAKALSGLIQENVNYLIQNCKLEPKADAALHVLITDLLRGGSLLAADPSSDEGASLIAQALRQYPVFFDHPGWISAPGAGS